MAEAQAVYAPEIVAQESLLVLENELVFARLVHRDFENEVAKYGDVVNTRKPTNLTATKWAGQATTLGAAADEITVQRPTATNVAVPLDKHVYTSFMEEDKPAAVSIKSLRDEFIMPSLVPIADYIDEACICEMIGATSTADATAYTGHDYAGNHITRVNSVASTVAAEDVIALRQSLNTAKCPAEPRFLVCSTEHEAQLLADTLFVQADQSGSTEALVNARLGRKFGFDCYFDQQIPNDATTATKAQSLAFHRNCLALVMRPLRQVPAGMGAVSAVQAYNNLAIRIVSAYNLRGMGIDIKFDCLFGVRLLDANLGRKLVG